MLAELQPGMCIRRAQPNVCPGCVLFPKTDGTSGTDGEHRGRAILMAEGKSQGVWGGEEPSTPPCVPGDFVEKRRSGRDAGLTNLWASESCPTFSFFKLELSQSFSKPVNEDLHLPKWGDKGQVWQATLCPKNDAKTELMLPTYAVGLRPPAKEIGDTAGLSHQSKMLRVKEFASYWGYFWFYAKPGGTEIESYNSSSPLLAVSCATWQPGMGM